MTNKKHSGVGSDSVEELIKTLQENHLSEPAEVLGSDDDPEIGRELLAADMQVSPLMAPVAMDGQPYRAYKLGFALPSGSVASKSGKPKKLSVDEAHEMVSRLFTDYIVSGLAGYAPIVPFLDALAFVVRQEDEKGKVSKILGIRAAYLWSALEILEKLASENLARISKDRNSKEFFANRKNLWIGSAIDRAKYVLNLKHDISLPEEGHEFKPQWMDADLRKKIQDLLVELRKVVKFATCVNDGKPVGIGRSGEPFLTCSACHTADLKAQKKTEELAGLNLKLAERNQLVRSLEDLLVEISAAGSYWIADMEKKGWNKAYVAFDNAFKLTIAWHTKKVAEIDGSIVTGKISDENRAAVEAEKGYLLKVLEEIRTYKHLTWCPTCLMPTYPKVGYHGPTKPCEACKNSSRKAAATDESDLQDLAEDAQDAGVGLTTANGQVLAVAEQIDPDSTPLPKKEVSAKQAGRWELGAINARNSVKHKKKK